MMTDKMIAVFKSNWRRFNPLVTDEFLDSRIETINKEHQHMESLRSDGEGVERGSGPLEKRNSSLQKVDKLWWLFVAVCAIAAILSS